MRWKSSCAAPRRARSSRRVSFRPCSMFQITVSLSLSRCSLQERPKRSRKPSARSVSNASVAPREVGLGVLDDAAELCKDLSLRFENRGHARIHRQAAEIAAPGDAHLPEVALERLARRREPGSRDRSGCARVGAGHRREAGTRQSATVRADRSQHARACPSAFAAGQLARGRASDESRRRCSSCRGCAGSPRGREPSANGSMPPPPRRAAPPEEPPQVFDRSYGLRVAPNTVLKVWLPAPNSGVLVLPMSDRAGGGEALDDEVVLCRDVVLVDQRAERGAHALRRHQVLVGDGQAGERAADALLAVQRLGGLERLLGQEGDDGVDLRVHALDLRDERPHHLGGGDLRVLIRRASCRAGLKQSSSVGTTHIRTMSYCSCV